jgi:CheY-specific phosphatase CheX
MHDRLQQAAVQAVSNVFETMFFVFLEPWPPEGEGSLPTATGGEWLHCLIGFEGRIRGKLRLWVPYGLACELATNFLGLETGASAAQALDMVKELANMICGNLFSILDKQQVYILTLPTAELVPTGPEGGEAGSPEALGLDFRAEDQRIRLEIEWGPPPVAQTGP